jgi:hypothetical protein
MMMALAAHDRHAIHPGFLDRGIVVAFKNTARERRRRLVACDDAILSRRIHSVNGSSSFYPTDFL